MKKFLYIFIIACLPVFSSCDDYLNIVPKGEKIPTTLADFESLLRDEYTIGQTPVSNALYLLNDYYVTVSNLNSPTLTRANYMWDESADRIMLNNSDEGTYYQMYAAISSCNLIIENAPTATEATDAERAEVIAYAKVIRSLCYYVLVNYYADTYEAATAGEKLSVPLIVSSVIDAPSEQVTIQEMYDFIIQGVEEAIDGGLPEESMTVIHPNLGAAYAFLARVYLQMQDYTKALEYAELALGQNSALYDWNAYYDDHIAAIENPDDAKFMSRWKYRSENQDTYYDGVGNGYFNWGGLTTCEVYLIKAECLARGGDIPGAMDVLNTVRQTRIRPDVYAPLTAADLEEAISLIRRTKDNELIFSIVPFADARRFNAEGTYARTLTKEYDGRTYTLTPGSHLWTMPFPAGAINNPGNGTITQNVDR